MLHCKGGFTWYRGAAFGGLHHIKGSYARQRGLRKKQAGNTRYSDLHLQQVPRGSTMYIGIHQECCTRYRETAAQVQGGCARNRGLYRVRGMEGGGGEVSTSGANGDYAIKRV